LIRGDARDGGQMPLSLTFAARATDAALREKVVQAQSN
jgi:hypothetical protein